MRFFYKRKRNRFFKRFRRFCDIIKAAFTLFFYPKKYLYFLTLGFPFLAGRNLFAVAVYFPLS